MSRTTAIEELASTFQQLGWCRFPCDPLLRAWVEYALPRALEAVSATANANWRRCGDTWFVGVNVLSNARDGTLQGGPPLAGAAVDFIQRELQPGGLPWDRAQVSVLYPGYPQPMAEESESAFRYRLERDAAHVDGLLAEGPERRRYLREHHAFILGIPLTECSADASPLVVWEGSHEHVRKALGARLSQHPTEEWPELDITEAYHRVRREVFARCRRVTLPARPGEAYLVHRLALHGMAPWEQGALAPDEGRVICYFRPELASPGDWLSLP